MDSFFLTKFFFYMGRGALFAAETAEVVSAPQLLAQLNIHTVSGSGLSGMIINNEGT